MTGAGIAADAPNDLHEPAPAVDTETLQVLRQAASGVRAPRRQTPAGTYELDRDALARWESLERDGLLRPAPHETAPAFYLTAAAQRLLADDDRRRLGTLICSDELAAAEQALRDADEQARDAMRHAARAAAAMIAAEQAELHAAFCDLEHVAIPVERIFARHNFDAALAPVAVKAELNYLQINGVRCCWADQDAALRQPSSRTAGYGAELWWVPLVGARVNRLIGMLPGCALTGLLPVDVAQRWGSGRAWMVLGRDGVSWRDPLQGPPPAP